ncbi:MAG: amidohydrolase [Myxococcales bacterium]|nr:amidohydrolase [Myxococcales bacterium]
MDTNSKGGHIDEIVAFRRLLHSEPELSFEEAQTSARVEERLVSAGLAVERQRTGHGLCAVVEGAHPGPTLGFRADMDALPILETNEVPHASKNRGVMHACGHDVHTSIGVGLAEQLVRERENLHGRVKFIFQPEEEAAAPAGKAIGAEAMALEGAVDDVDAILALHVLPRLQVGRFGVSERAVWAASDVFDITIKGSSAHGATPHQGRDAIRAACALADALYGLPGRETDANTACVLSIGQLHAGTAHNIIADRATISGILRTIDDPTRDLMLNAINRITKGVSAAYGAEAEIDIRLGAKAVHNDPSLREQVLSSLRSNGAEVDTVPSQMGAEDFSAFSSRVPGCYLYLGVGNIERGIVHDIHTPRFDVDEQCIGYAMSHIGKTLVDLGKHLKGATR